MANEQIRFKFDSVTWKKIGKGALIAVTGAIGVYVTSVIGDIQGDMPLVASLVAWLVPTLVNVVKEWAAGV